MNRSKSSFSFASLLVVLIVFLVNYFQKRDEPSRSSSRSSQSRGTSRTRERQTPPANDTVTNRSTGSDSNEGNLLLGNASNAATGADNFLLERPQYTMSFNRARGGPNWVAWHVDAADLGEADRGKFRPDPDLPASWRITPKDYSNSGYDRGHMCPSADRNGSRQDNDTTFYMSNMVPQTAALNQHVWADLENYVRDTVRAGNEVYQICGVTGEKETIANGKVTVPASCWKVILVLPESRGDLARITAQTRVIAVSMPNEQSDELQNGDWRTYLTSVKKLENATGLNFFAALPKKVEKSLESKVDRGE
jgi:endonuclease G, mitochondrial